MKIHEARAFNFTYRYIKTFDFSTLYTTLPHDKLKTRLKETIHKAFSHRNYGSKCVVLGYNSTYCSSKIQKGKTCYSEEQVISMLEFHWYILQSWKLKRPQIQLRPHHFWTYTSNLTTVVNSVLKFMINGTTSILKS